MKSSTPEQRNTRLIESQTGLWQGLGAAVAIVCLVVTIEQIITSVGFFNEGQAVWWPTNGLALALLLRTERRRWWLVLGSVVAASMGGVLFYRFPASVIISNFLANSAGPLLGALMLPHFTTLEEWLQKPKLVYRYVACVLVAAPLLSAAIYAGYMQFSPHDHSFWTTLQRRGVADMLGYALFTPLALVVSSRETYRLAQTRALPKTVLLLSLMACAATVVFSQSSYALSFVLASVTLLVTLHLGFSAAVIGVNLVAAISTAATMHGHGPFTLGGGTELSTRILLLQAFLTLSMIAVFSVSVIQVEREVFQSKLTLAYEYMEHLATIDPLTGISNRRRFEESLEVEWARAERSGETIAVLMIDADHFKSYNDSFGHLAGDDCLRALTRVAGSMERRPTDLLARYGGEEFIFLLPNSSLQGAARIGEMLRGSVERLHEDASSGLRRKVTVSVGCGALVPRPGMSPATLIEASDRALYRAKQNGRNRVEIAEMSVSASATHTTV